MDDSFDAMEYFRALPEAARAEIFDNARKTSLSAGQTLFLRDDPAEFLYIIIDGEIAIETISLNGKTVRVATLGAGEVIGELGVLGEIQRTADARAVGDATLLTIDARAFRRTLSEQPGFALDIMKLLIERLRQTNEQVEYISTRPLRERIALLLLRRSAASNESPILTITQSELATAVNASREKVNTHLQHMRKNNAIALARGRIDILDRAWLQNLVDD